MPPYRPLAVISVALALVPSKQRSKESIHVGLDDPVIFLEKHEDVTSSQCYTVATFESHTIFVVLSSDRTTDS